MTPRKFERSLIRIYLYVQWFLRNRRIFLHTTRVTAMNPGRSAKIIFDLLTPFLLLPGSELGNCNRLSLSTEQKREPPPPKKKNETMLRLRI